MPLRLAMWSGPRNISTALMRSWGSRADTFVCDEPLYAHYLRQTGRSHPLREEVIAAQENDWRKVVAWLTGELPQGKAVFYQKHMAHHLLPEIGRDWFAALTHCLLIREPREVITSYIKKARDPEIEDTGFPQLAEIFDLVRIESGATPPVLDARDVLENPRRLLGLLCDAVGVAFDEQMLEWQSGLRDTDGIWARHWYSEVATSTTFRPYTQKSDTVPKRLQHVYEASCEYYQRLYSHRLR